MGKTRRGNWADVLTQMDDFTGRVLDALDELGLAENTIVVWSSDNGADPPTAFRPVIPIRSAGSGRGSPGRGAAAYSPRWKAPTGRQVSSAGPARCRPGRSATRLVHEVDWFTTLLLAAGAEVPGDRMIDGMDMRDFLLGEDEQSGRDAILCFQGPRLQAVKWRQWKAHLFKQDEAISTWSAYNVPHIHNLEWDPREEHEIDFPHGWVLHPMATAAGAFLKSLLAEPPIKPGTPDPYTPPNRESYAPSSTSRSARSPSTSRPLPRSMRSPQNHITASSMRVAEDGDSRFLHEGSQLRT